MKVQTLSLVGALLLGLQAVSLPMAAPARAPEKVEQPAIQDLGNNRYRIGHIEIDKVQQRFTVAGVVLRLKPPLEFLAVAKGGFKAYESLLELQANAYEFNLACILIGLDPDKGQAPRFHFDPEPAQGDGLELWVSWQQDGKAVRVEAADLIRLEQHTMPRGQWVYTGSSFTPDRQYRAHLEGSLIGFVHDPASVIEHRSGFGLRHFGDIVANAEVMPPIGTQVTLTVVRKK